MAQVNKKFLFILIFVALSIDLFSLELSSVKKVLVLNSYHEGYHWTDNIDVKPEEGLLYMMSFNDVSWKNRV